MEDLPAPQLWTDPIQVIRTETVLSRLPIHNLSKTGPFEIHITRRKASGELELHWSVSHSARYGPPRQLAYKLDTLVINRRIDELGRPVANLIRLGSLRDIARQLDLGGDTNQIRRAFRQNAFTGITARLSYRSVDGIERKIEADFTRYSVVFAGETLPDGSKADAVYLVLNEPYLEVVNSAPLRPLNYEYLKQLTPAAQRFYEIISYRIYSALKYATPHAKLTYSDFCTFSALQHYSDYEHFKKQMYKIHRPHLVSGYIEAVYYEDSVDADGNSDWNMLYVAGPKARAEFELFDRGKPKQRTIEDGITEQMRRRGIPAAQARRLISEGADPKTIQAQLEWGDRLIAQSRKPIYNPPGFYTYLIREKILPPADLSGHSEEVSGEESGDKGAQADLAYAQYRQREIDRHLSSMYSQELWERAVRQKENAIRRQYRSADFWTPESVRQVAEGALRADVAKQVALLSFQEFCERHKGDSC